MNTLHAIARADAVAVVIPCHNYGRWLGECLESVLAQTHAPAEIVVVDDASTDETRSVAALFAERGVRYLRVEVRNPHAARRAGITATSAPLVCCVDADDQLSAEYLERAVPLFRDAAVAIAWSPLQEFGDRAMLWDPPPGTDVTKRNWIHAGAVVRRSAIDSSRAFQRDNHHTVEDVETWRRILDQGWQHARNPALYRYRKHSDSRSKLRPRHLDRVILSTYFVSRPDPQSGKTVDRDRWDLVAPWAAGIRTQRLRGVIFHDGLSNEFIARCAEHSVECVLTPPMPDTTHANAWRFFVAADWLGRQSLETAFLTDLFDVTIKADPFALLRTDFDLWIGTEPWTIDETTGPGRWITTRLQATFGAVDPLLAGQTILNCGITGGFRAPLLALWWELWSVLSHRGAISYDHTRPDIAASEMAALNHLVYRRPDLHRVWRQGAPLHSRFKSYEADADVCFVHK